MTDDHPTDDVDETKTVRTAETADTDTDTDTDATEATDAEKADVDATDVEKADVEKAETEPVEPARGIDWRRVVAFIVLPAVALLLAAGAGYLKWLDDSYRDGAMTDGASGRQSPAEISVQVARESTIALLSYAPDTVEQQLGAARDLLTGEFQDSYTSLTNDVVIPGAKEQQISAVASVPAAASVSMTPDEAVVLLFVNQTVTVGTDPPTDTASSVRVTLVKDGDRWLISQFDPV